MTDPSSTCPRCGAPFDCGAGTGSCWCAGVALDEITRASFAQFYDGCLCRECLLALAASRPAAPSARAFLAGQLRRRRARRQGARRA